MTLRTGNRLGHFEIVTPLGAGGMGEVYKAHDTRLGRDVAIKVLSEHLVKKAGLSPMDAIKAGTSVAAELLDQSARIGTLKPGMVADIVAVADNRLEDLATLQPAAFVMKDGVIIRDDQLCR